MKSAGKMTKALLGWGLTVLLFFALVGHAAAVTLNPGDILVVDPNAFGGAGGVIKVDPITGAQTTISSGGAFVDPVGIAIAPNGDIFVTDLNAFGGSGGVTRVDPVTGAQTPISSGGFFVDPFGIAIEANGQLVVTDVGSPAVIRVHPITGAQTLVSSGGNLSFPSGITVAPDGNLIVGDANAFGSPPFNTPSNSGGAIFRVDPVTGAQTVISSGSPFFDPQGVVLDAAGQILVADQNSFVGGSNGCGGGAGAIFRVDPATGTKTVITTGMVIPTGRDFITPITLALDANGQILVADAHSPSCSGTGAVIRVDPATGVKAIVSTGGLFVDPVGIAIVSTVPFAAFAADVEIDLGPLANDDAFEVKATFTLGAGSNGIAPLTEDVHLQVGTFSTTIPAGSFEFRPAEGNNPAQFRFEGVIGVVSLEAKIILLGANTFAFKVEGQGADLTATVNPVTVGLVIGNDGGSTTVTAEFK